MRVHPVRNFVFRDVKIGISNGVQKTGPIDVYEAVAPTPNIPIDTIGNYIRFFGTLPLDNTRQ